MISLLETKIGRDPTKYILPHFLKNKTDLLNALLNSNDLWINYFDSLGGMIYKDVKYLNAIIDSGNIEYMKFYNGANWDLGLKRACLGGNIDVVKLMIKKGANDWNCGLRGACLGGNMKCVELMIHKGAWDWNMGLECACRCGIMEIVKLMIHKGAYYWDRGLRGACAGGHMEIIHIMLEKGANYWN